MTRFRVLVADDEPLARGIVANLLKGDPGDRVGVRMRRRRQRSRGHRPPRPDIAFLDVEMPGATGLQVAGELPDAGPIVVFITAFSGYAPQAFDVSATDYVLKPFSDERFREALERAKRRVRERRLGALANQVATLSAELEHDGARASRRMRRAICSVSPSRTAIDPWCSKPPRSSGSRPRTTTCCSTRSRAGTWCGPRWRRSNGASIPGAFVRVHRTAIVNVDEVRAIRDSGQLLLTLSDGAEVGGEPVPTAPRRALRATAASLTPAAGCASRSRPLQTCASCCKTPCLAWQRRRMIPCEEMFMRINRIVAGALVSLAVVSRPVAWPRTLRRCWWTSIGWRST